MKTFILILPYIDKGSQFHYHKANWADYENFVNGKRINAESLQKAIEEAIPLYKEGIEENTNKLNQLVLEGKITESKRELMISNYPQKIRLYEIIDVDLGKIINQD